MNVSKEKRGTAAKPLTRSIEKYAILLATGILAESKEQEGPLLFSSRAQAESELRFRPRREATVVRLLIAFVDENKS